MTAKVFNFPGHDPKMHDAFDENIALEADVVLSGFLGKLDTAAVLGIDTDGRLTLASTHSIPHLFYLMERARYALISGSLTPRDDEED